MAYQEPWNILVSLSNILYCFSKSSASGKFRHIPALFKSILTHIQNLLYPWCIQNLAYFYHKEYSDSTVYSNTLLNIFTKAQSWTFDTVLNVPVFFYRCCLTSRVTLRLYFRYIDAYSRLTLPYLILLRDSKSPAIFIDILVQPYSGIL